MCSFEAHPDFPSSCLKGESGKSLQQRDQELKARSHEIHDLKATVALLHARVEHQQRQTMDQVMVMR